MVGLKAVYKVKKKVRLKKKRWEQTTLVNHFTIVNIHWWLKNLLKSNKEYLFESIFLWNIKHKYETIVILASTSLKNFKVV